MEKAYSRITWVNNMPPAINESNLNHIEAGLDTVDTRVVTLDTTKANVSTVNTAIQSLTLDTETGVFTITKIDGTVLYLESSQGKIATNFTYDEQNQRLVLTLADGTTQYVDMSALITEYEFNNSNTISFVVASDGSISANINNGSITDAMLENGYLATLTTLKTQAQGYRNEAHDYASNAEYDANLSRSYAIGTNGEIRQGDATDNAKYYCEEAQRQAGTTVFYNSVSNFPAVGVEGKLYVAKDTGYMYRYNTASNTYVQVGGSGSGTIFYDSLSDFPQVGVEDTVYVAKDTNQMYRWRTEVNAYINVGGGDAENVAYWRQDYGNVSDALDSLFSTSDDSYIIGGYVDTTMDNADRIPFFDVSNPQKKNITLSNFVNTIAPNFASQIAVTQGYSLDLLDKDGNLLDAVAIQTTADRVSYTDTYSIGLTNIQGAVDRVVGDSEITYKTSDATDTTLDNADYIPFIDVSANVKKKIPWANIVNKIKSSFASYFGRKLSQSDGKLSLLTSNNIFLDTVTLSPLATNTSYTDTNNIGATNVQSAVDILGSAPVLLCTLTSDAPSQSGIDISPYKMLWFARRSTLDNYFCGDIGTAVPSFINNVRNTYGRAYIETFGDSVQETGWVSFNFGANNTITLSWGDEDAPPRYAEYYVYGIK